MCPEYFTSDLTPIRDELLAELRKLRKELLKEDKITAQKQKSTAITDERTDKEA